MAKTWFKAALLCAALVLASFALTACSANEPLTVDQADQRHQPHGGKSGLRLVEKIQTVPPNLFSIRERKLSPWDWRCRDTPP